MQTDPLILGENRSSLYRRLVSGFARSVHKYLGDPQSLSERERRELIALRAALDEVDYGVALLDRELRAKFINRAFRRIFKLSDAMADSRPPFVALMYHGRNTRAYEVPEDKLADYVAERVAHVRAGDRVPRDLRLSNGEVLRFQSIPLPNGGRMLSYTQVTDIVRHADELQTLATIDELTNVYNRRHFLTLARGEWARFQRYGRPLSLLLLDIDHFKSFNDRFGHATGDKILREVARILTEGKRDPDTVGRLGGEEFAMLLPETELGPAVRVAERLRLAAQDYVIPLEDEDIRVNVSIGVAEASLSMSGIDRLLKDADDALYGAKRAGRNQVMVRTRFETPPMKIAAE